MRKLTLGLFIGLVSACGSDGDGIGTNPGNGTGNLLVRGQISLEDGSAEAVVDVSLAGQDVIDAVVVVDDGDNEVTLTHAGGGEYRGTLPGWKDGYHVRVDSGSDFVEGSIEAPSLPDLTYPVAGQAFDPMADSDGIIEVTWSGESADTVRLKTKDFEFGPVADTGTIDVPAVTFTDDTQDIEIRRENHVDLIGGAPGSDLEADCERKTEVIVVNPFPG